jgi:hypothetical protein
MLGKISTAFRNASAVLKSRGIVPSFAGSTSAYTFVAVMSFSQLADGPSDHELRRQDALAEGHSRMM